MIQENYYQVLGLRRNATQEEIRQAYLSLYKSLNSDKLLHNSSENLKRLAEKRMEIVNVAYSTLSDENLRRQYDLKITKELGYNQSNGKSFKKIICEELISEAILEQGLNDLFLEEEKLYDSFLNEIKSIQDNYKNYLSSISNSDMNDFYPDNLISRINKYLKIFYFYIPWSIIVSSLLSRGVLLVAEIFNTCYMILFRKSSEIITIITPDNLFLLAFISFVLIIKLFLSNKDEYTNSQDKISSNYYIFSGKLKSFYIKFMMFGWDIEFSNFYKPLYKNSYTNAMRKSIDKFKKQLKILNSSRNHLVNKFKKSNSKILKNPSYIEKLAYSERFLLIKALEEKQVQSKNNTLEIIVGITLIAFVCLQAWL